MLKVLKCYKFFSSKRCYAKKDLNIEMKYLNVAEKNDAAKTIAGQLSNGTARRREGLSVYNKIYEFEATVLGRKSKMVMTSVSGHLLTFEFLSSYRNWNNVDPQSLFDAPVRKACSENFAAIKRTLEREVRSCNGLIVWTDCDREGENIGFEIIDVCRAVKPNITVYRAIFSEITKASVNRALQNLTQPDKRQSDAVDVRSELDLRTGAAITRFQTMRLQRLFPEKISDKLISYGSCQIPTLGFVAERYKEIEAFVSEPFWKIKVTHTIEDLTVEFLWARNRLFDKQACEDYYLLVIANPTATVESVTVKPKSKWRPTPLDTVELEKLGSRKLKLSAKEVMTIAEKLYTKGIISYPRTETNMFSKEIDLKSLVEQQTGHGVWGSFAQRVAEWGPNPRNGNKSDQAHPPIHPTKMVPNLDGNEGRVYELICRHFLACVSKDATGSETIVTISIEGEKFTATGLVIYERNYLDVYIYDKWNAKQIHKYEQGQKFEPTEITMPEGATTAPPLLTEADLIALMEKHGIGTDATHAEHINTIKERGYIGVVDKGCLVPGVIGMGLYEGYDAMELALAKPMLRAEFEQDLKKICLGEKDPKTVLREQIVKYKEAYKQIMDKISAMDEKMAQRILETPNQHNTNNTNSNSNTESRSGASENQNRLQEIFKCPKCSIAPMALKPKKNQTGFLIGCLNFPDCKNCIWWPDECKEPHALDETCNKCGSEMKLIKFKFSNPYHKAMFNCPSGWYKICLRCDEQFRNIFNINLDSVKRVGPIVADISSIPINYGVTTQPAPAAGSNNNTGGKKSKSTTTKTKTTNDAAGETETKAKKTRKPSTKTTTTSANQKKQTGNTNIRSYFTAAPQQTADEIAASELQDMPIDAFFDSNDGFDDLILSAEANIPVTTSTTTSRTTPQTRTETVLSDDLAAAFNDDDDDMFADFQWGSGNQNVNKLKAQRQSNTTTTTSASAASARNRAEIDESFSEWLQDDNDLNDDDYVWGSAAKSARLSEVGPSLKKFKSQNTETTNDDSYGWGSTSRVVTEETALNVKCTGCHQPAKELSVKKDGPNKGRMFFVCAKSGNPCKFFQWADEIEQQNHSSNAQTSTSSTSNWGSSANSRTSISTDNNSNWGSSSSSNRINTTSTNWGSRDADIPVSKEQVNCNCNKPASSLTVRKEGPNKGRDFYACANRDKSCGFFQWADQTENTEQSSTYSRADTTSTNWGSGSSSNRANTANSSGWGSREFESTDNAEKVNCNCNKPANSLTVRKEGPNKGRNFYACSNRDQSCGFFQWAEQTEDDSQRSWGSSSSASTSANFKPVANKKDDSKTAPKGRKCGLCRQEGHSRQKCPRKGEFEF
ncbi:DNA topoisomerase 3-alpha [Lucilia cuprina]|uniref:DNA topoisomerase 3-alpha n=1 Tax=Lucilia cuprina TaxID=7375 RepID=UPI001F055FDB|nr:DNA topoisomerase 3-alpha [Lucilia cuprina]